MGQPANWTIMYHCSPSSAYIAILKGTMICGANKLGASGQQAFKGKYMFAPGEEY